MSWRAKLPVEIAGSRVEVALHASYDLGEGALFDSQAREYLHVNINGRTATRHNLETGVVRNYQLPTTVGTIVPRRGGGAVVALDGGPAALNYETGAITPLAPTFAQPATSRCNDGKCGPDGRLYFGTMPRDCRLPVGKLYVLDHDHTLRTLLDGVTISNGLAWSADGRTMYYIDTPTGAVDALDFDAAAGTVSNRRVAFTVPPDTGAPDGCTMDSEGKLWVAQWGGSRVVRYDPGTGAVLAVVRVPTAHVTSVAFGGPDLGDMYITTARAGADAASEPLAGHVFVVRRCGFTGVRAHEFDG